MMRDLRLFKKIGVLLIVLVGMVVGARNVEGATRTASVSGVWSSTATWGGTAVPVAGDAVVINSGITVTLDVDTPVLLSVTINAMATGGTNGLNVGTYTLNTGSITIGGSNNNGRNSTLSVSTGIINVTGNISSSGTAAQSRIVCSDAATINVGGNYRPGAFTASSSTVNLNGSGAQSLGAFTYNELNINGANSTTTAAGNITCANLTVNANNSFNIATRTITINGNWTNDGTILGTSGRLTGSTGTFTNNGAINLSTGGIIQTTGSLTNSATGTITFTGTGTITFGTGNFINLNSSTNVNFGSSAITITGTAVAQSIGGFRTTNTVSCTKASGTATFTGDVNGGAFTKSGNGTLNLGDGLTHTFTGTWTRTAGEINGNSSTLKIGGTVTNTAGTFTAGTSTVNYTGGTQTIANVTYNNLILSGTLAKTIPAGTSISGNLSIRPGGVGTATASIATGQNIVVGSLTLGGIDRACGTWGYGPATPPTNKDQTYFTSSSGYLTVGITPSTPVVGTITQPTCTIATGSVDLSGLPSGNWTINPGSISGSGSSTTISGLVAGTYNFTVTNSGGCISAASGNVAINAQPITPVNVTGSSASVANASSTLNWTNPTDCYEEIMIVAKATSAVTGTPNGDGTTYTGDLTFGSGTAFGGGFVVYIGTGSPQTVTNLNNGTIYYFKFFTRNGTNWSTGIETTATPAALTSASDYFRSKTSGDWNVASTWESSANGTTWIDATLAPNSSAQSILIQSGHTVYVITTPSYNNLTVSGTYEHRLNGGTIPTAAWDANSTCLITGANGNAPNGGDQNFGNFTWDCSGQNNYLVLGGTGSTTAIRGNLKIDNTNPGTNGYDFAIEQDITVGGDLIITSGIYRICYQANRILTINGDVNITGGQLLMNSSGTTNANGTLNVVGNFNFSGGTINARANNPGSSLSNINFTGTGMMQTYTSGGTITSSANANIINFTVISPAYLQMGTGASPSTLTAQTIGGTNTFTLSSGATLGITSPDGITSSGATGNIQVTGTRVYDASANYIFNGTATQNTGDGLTTANILTIDNSTGVLLTNDVTVNSTLEFTSGKITTGSNTLALASGANVIGAGAGKYVYGNLLWNIPTGAQSRTFYIGDANNYAPASISFTNLTTAGTLTASTNASSHPNLSSSSISTSKYVKRYHSLTIGGGLVFSNSTNTADLTLNWVPGDIQGGADYTQFIVGKYSSGWEYPTISNLNSTNITNTGLTSLGDFQVGEVGCIVPTPPTTAMMSPISTDVCENDVLTLSGPASGGTDAGCTIEYQYSNDDGANWSPASTTIPSFSAVPGTNIIQARRNNCATGCTSFTDWNTIASWTVGAIPETDFTVSNNTIDPGNSVDYTDASSNSPTSWLWTFPGGNPSSSTDQNPTGITYDLPGIYSARLTATNDCGSFEEIKTEFITVNSACSNKIWDETFSYSDGTTTGAGTPAITSWTADGTSSGLGIDVRSNRLQGRNTQSGTPTDTWQIDTGNPISITGYSDVSVSMNISEGGRQESDDYIRIQYSVDGGPWTDFSNNGYRLDDFGSAVASQTGLSGSTLRIRIIMHNNADAEYYYADNISVTGEQNPIVNNPGNQTVASGDLVSINFTGSTDYSWTNDNLNIGLLGSGTGSISFTAENLGTNNEVANITVTPIVGTCTGTPETFTITVTPACITPSISSNPTGTSVNYCLNITASPLLVTAAGDGLTYQWYSNLTASNSGGTEITGETNTSITPSTSIAGTTYYYCVVSGTCGTVTSNVSGAIIVNAAPSVDLSPTDETCASSNDGTISTSLTGGLSNIRYIKLTQKFVDPNAWQQVEEIEAYEVFTGTNVAVSGTASSSSVYNGDNSTYGPSKVIDGVTTGYNFWHSGTPNVNEWILVDLGSGKNIDYLKIYNREDCCWFRGQNMLLELFDSANNLVYSKTVNLWEGIDGAHSIVEDVLNLNWNDSGTTFNRSGLTAGTYTLNYSDVVGCTANSSATISTTNTESTDPTSITASNSICIGESITLNVSGGSLGTNAVWKWYSGSCSGTLVGTGSSINVSPSENTTYYVRAEGLCNTTGCASKIITVNALPVPTIGGDTSPCAETAEVIYTTESGMTNYTWSVSTGGTITSGDGTNTIYVTWSDPGVKTVSVNYTNGSSCTAPSATVLDVNVNPLPNPVITTN